jgi:hypothetical protein
MTLLRQQMIDAMLRTSVKCLDVIRNERISSDIEVGRSKWNHQIFCRPIDAHH